MYKTRFIFLLVPLFVLIAFSSSAQRERELGMGEEGEEESVDEVEIEPEIRMWTLSGYGAFQDSTKLDTLQDYYHLFHPVYKNAITATYVGNYGTPYINNDFFNRDSKMDFYFLKSREAYLLMPEIVEYYNTRTPYTLLDYSQSENKNKKNETRFNVLHTQNVNPYLNFTFRYDQATSDGQYQQQSAKNNFVTIYSSYNKDQLSIHSGFISNTIKNYENGGLTNDSLIFSDEDSDLLNVNLSSSQSIFSSAYFFANGEYRLGKFTEATEEEPAEFKPVVGILYSFKYERHKQEFLDEEDTTNVFFPETYYGDEFLKDSIRYNKLSNVVQIKQYENADKKTSFGKRVFLGQEYSKADSPGRADDVLVRRTKGFSNIYAGGGIFRETGNFWVWNFEGKFYFLGRNIGQTELKGVISKPLTVFGDSLASLNIRGAVENTVEDYFEDEFYSNHVKWKNHFNMEQRMTVKGSFRSPANNLEAGVNYALINNFIYVDTLGIPAQTSKELLVLSAYLDKDFNYRNLHFRTRLLWQKVSNEDFLHLPEFSTFVSAYYKFRIEKVLYSQIGIDLRYNTSYYADEYAPSTGLFHLQDETKVGNYPYIDAYASIRLKRTRLFFNMMNVGTMFLNKAYYTTPHYPMNRATFRLGVAWAFYD